MSGKQLGSQAGGSIIDRDLVFYEGEEERCEAEIFNCPREKEWIWRMRARNARVVVDALRAYKYMLSDAPEGATE